MEKEAGGVGQAGWPSSTATRATACMGRTKCFTHHLKEAHTKRYQGCQAICEAVPYYHQYQGAPYHKNGKLYGMLVDNDQGQGHIWIRK